MTLVPVSWLLLGLAGVGAAKDACVSGPQVGQRPGPYSALVSVGANRGQLHCFICETADRPAVIVFARTPTRELAKLAQGLDQAVIKHKAAEMRSWITFLHDDHLTLDAKVVRWARENALGTIPVCIFEDVEGPPVYRLARDAEVTVLLFVKQKVVHNFALRAGELNDKKTEAILKAVQDLLK